MVVAAPGHRWEKLRVEAFPGQVTDVGPVELHPAEMVEGVVVDSRTGLGIEGATLISVDPQGVLEERSGEAGRFSVAMPDGDALTVLVHASGYARREATLREESLAAADERWVIELDPGGRIRATVWEEDGDQPCGGCTVIVDRPGASSLDLRVSLRTASDGSAETGPLAPGLYWVLLEEAQSFGSLVTVRAGHNQKQAMVESGVVTEVVFRPRGAI